MEPNCRNTPHRKQTDLTAQTQNEDTTNIGTNPSRHWKTQSSPGVHQLLHELRRTKTTSLWCFYYYSPSHCHDWRSALFISSTLGSLGRWLVTWSLPPVLCTYRGTSLRTSRWRQSVSVTLEREREKREEQHQQCETRRCEMTTLFLSEIRPRLRNLHDYRTTAETHQSVWSVFY